MTILGRLYTKGTINFTQNEIDATFILNTKRQHRVPVLPRPKYDMLIGKLTWEDDFNHQGKYAWTNGEEFSYAKQPYEIGDTVKVFGTDRYIEIVDIKPRRLHDFSEEDLIEQGKNYFGTNKLTNAQRDVLLERYELEWNDYIGIENVPNFGYYTNIWIWEIKFKPVFNKKSKKVDVHNKRKNL